jgi:branched-chain amino acid transport system permease protein
VPESTAITDLSTTVAKPAAPTAATMGQILPQADGLKSLRLLHNPAVRLGALVTAVAAIGLLASANDSLLSIANLGLIAAIAAIGLNLAMGSTGILSMGHAVFVGFGAFTAAVLADFGASFFVGALAGMAIATVASLAIGPLALRLSGLYLAVGTIGIAYVGQHLFVNLRTLTGGGAGRLVESPTIFGISMAQDSAIAGRLITSDMKWFILLVILTLLLGTAVASLGRLRWGRAFRAVRDNENSAAAAGIAVIQLKVTSFGMSAAIGGLAGALLASYLRFLNPETFGLDQSLQYLAMIIIGGLGSVSGAIIGALLITVLPTLLTEVSTSMGLVEQASGTSGSFNTGTLAIMSYGLIIVLVMTLAPQGISGGLSSLAKSLTSRMRPTKNVQTSRPQNTPTKGQVP